MAKLIKGRVFNGKRYSLFDWASTKREAEQEKRQQKKAGKLVRLTVPPSKEGYFVWVR